MGYNLAKIPDYAMPFGYYRGCVATYIEIPTEMRCGKFNL